MRHICTPHWNEVFRKYFWTPLCGRDHSLDKDDTREPPDHPTCLWCAGSI